jgi:hypothetical protein
MIKLKRYVSQGMWQVWERWEMCTLF